MKSSTRPAGRTRNPRGEGGRLRGEIVRAAAELLEKGEGPDAVTLRAVAREVGISAPSIYAHFDDREQIIDAVLVEAFDQMTEVVNAADARETDRDPVERLYAGCQAYLDFAAEQPQRYRLLFSRGDVLTRGASEGLLDAGARALGTLIEAVQRCVDAGRSESDDAETDAVAVWVALHGWASLSYSAPDFTWPSDGILFRKLVDGLARITS